MEDFWQIKVDLWRINGKIAVKVPIIFHVSFGDKRAGEFWEDFWHLLGSFVADLRRFCHWSLGEDDERMRV
jgi:hypothetical protein